MRRLTLRLPETLFHRLQLLADSEGISLNQYLVYSLTQNAAKAYRIIPVSKEEIERQHALFETLLESIEPISDEEFDAILAEGEPADENDRVDPELAAQLEAKFKAVSAARKEFVR